MRGIMAGEAGDWSMMLTVHIVSTVKKQMGMNVAAQLPCPLYIQPITLTNGVTPLIFRVGFSNSVNLT